MHFNDGLINRLQGNWSTNLQWNETLKWLWKNQKIKKIKNFSLGFALLLFALSSTNEKNRRRTIWCGGKNMATDCDSFIHTYALFYDIDREWDGKRWNGYIWFHCLWIEHEVAASGCVWFFFWLDAFALLFHRLISGSNRKIWHRFYSYIFMGENFSRAIFRFVSNNIQIRSWQVHGKNRKWHLQNRTIQPVHVWVWVCQCV